MPALAITMSMPPNRSMPLSAAACMAARSRTSATTVSTRSSPSRVGHLLEQHLVQVGQHQLGALGVQAAGHFRADAIRAAGDQGDFSAHRTHGGRTYPGRRTDGAGWPFYSLMPSRASIAVATVCGAWVS